MKIPKRIFRLANQRALAGFTALTEKTLIEADSLLANGMLSAPSAEQRPLTQARAFLRAEGTQLRRRMEQHFSGYLERAMQTMHTDLRASLDSLRADNLSLIDDEVVTRQIEVDRLVQRLRDADEMSLGRINLIIAQLHGESDVRERENPFRPYLLARALHEGLRDVLKEDWQAKLLFDTLSVAMTKRLPGFYTDLLDVFESNGMSSKLVARPSALTRTQRERLAWQQAAEQMLNSKKEASRAHAPSQPQGMQARMLPRLQSMMDLPHPHFEPAPGANPVSRLPTPDLHDVLWNVFNQPKGGRWRPAPQSADGDDDEPAPLDAQLRQLQRAAARQAAGLQVQSAPQPLELREQIADDALNPPDRLTIDLVSLLFESIMHDEHMTPTVRQQLGRLHVPFLRAAMLEPDMLHDPAHPARRLLDRVGTLTAGITPDMACYPAVEKEIDQVVCGLLESYDGDSEVFTESENMLDSFVSTLLPAGDKTMALCEKAMNEAESASAVLHDTLAVLQSLLEPLEADPRVVAFITDTWSHVMVNPATSYDACKALLPELLWSAQEKVTPEDRNAMLRMLPGLVHRVREGLGAIGLRELSLKNALDHLVSVHMDVLANKQPSSPHRRSLDELRRHCESYAFGDATAAAGDDAAVPVGEVELGNSLKRYRVTAIIHAEEASPAATGKADWLSMARPGAGFETRVDGVFAPARLSVVSARRSLYLFTVGKMPLPLIFTRAALLAAVQSGMLQTVEHAPVFDRAIESLMQGAESLVPA